MLRVRNDSCSVHPDFTNSIKVLSLIINFQKVEVVEMFLQRFALPIITHLLRTKTHLDPDIEE